MTALTEKQQQVQDKLDLGKSVKEIARDMRITPNAVHGHIRKIKDKGGSATTGKLAPQNGNGGVQSEALKAIAENLVAARELADERIDTIDSLTEEIEQEIRESTGKLKRLTAEREALAKAQDAVRAIETT